MKPINVKGRCRCARVTFVLCEEPIAFYLCHCTDCQAESGSAFGQSMAVRNGAIDGVEGPVAEHEVEGRDGRRIRISHCANCLTHLWGATEGLPQILGLNSGSLDATSGLRPHGNMWVRSKRDWVALAPGPVYEEQPEDPLAMARAWATRPAIADRANQRWDAHS